MESQGTTNASTTPSAAYETLPAKRVFLVAGICLLVGLVAGYVLRDQQPPAAPVQGAPTQSAPPQAGAQRMPSVEEMRHMADKQAAPLLEKLKSDPGNSALLAQVGTIYHATHQFKQAVIYLNRAVQAEPKNAAIRTKLAISLYRSGDADGAVTQLQRSLKDSPNDANALFNLGVIELHGKRNSRAALNAWERLLKTNPQLNPQRKAEVQHLIAQVMNMLGDQNGTQGARRANGSKTKSL